MTRKRQSDKRDISLLALSLNGDNSQTIETRKSSLVSPCRQQGSRALRPSFVAFIDAFVGSFIRSRAARIITSL